MSQEEKRNQHWNDYWQNAGRDDQALGGKKQREVLQEHWRTLLRGAQKPLSILDVASGSGAIFDAIELPSPTLEVGGLSLFVAADESVAAVKQASSKNLIQGVTCDASNLPFENQSFDLAVSQFGIEYAGIDAFLEAARLIRPGGTLNFISHYHDGAIFKECKEQSRVLSVILENELFDVAARAILPTIQQRNVSNKAFVDQKAEEKLRQVALETRDVLTRSPVTSARNLLNRYFNDLIRLSERRLAYKEGEAAQWLSSASDAIHAYFDRMEAMTKAALTSDDVSRLTKMYSELGVELDVPVPIVFSEDGTPGAWHLKGQLKAN